MTAGFIQGWESIAKKSAASSDSIDERSEYIRVRLDIEPSDPLIQLLERRAGPIEVASLDLDSPALSALRDARTDFIVPLVSSDGLVGLLAVASKAAHKEEHRSRDWLFRWSSRAAASLRLAQLIEHRRNEGERRERELRDLEVARLVQRRLLPGGPRTHHQWHVWPYYSSAESIGGDFYDFIELSGGYLGVVAGDVAGKGVSGALGMASARSVIRHVSREAVKPAEILREVNDALVEDLPDGMFVTCAYLVLSPESGRVVCANAGHNPPVLLRSGTTRELDVRGMPLGMLPGSVYRDVEISLEPEDALFVYSDGLLEARSHGNMLGAAGVSGLLHGQRPESAEALIRHTVDGLLQFTGRGWEQDDDITLLAIVRGADSQA